MFSRLEEKRDGAVGQLRLLLIEDNPADARLVEELVDESGTTDVQIEVEPRLKSGIASMRRKKFDIILLDLNLPDSSGIQTYEKLRSDFSLTPIIILTGSDDEELAVLAIQRGAQDYIIKGEISGRGLLRAVRYAIERKHSENFLASLDKITKEAIWSGGLETVVGRLLGTLLSVLDADLAAVFLSKNHRILACDRNGKRELIWSKEQFEETYQIVIDSKPRFIDDVNAIAALKESFLPSEIRTILSVPLQSDEDVMGGLMVAWSSAHIRSSREDRLLQVAAERFSAAILNAQYLGAIEDLAERLENERRLLSNIFESSSVGLCLVGPDNKVIMANDVWYRSTGFTPASAVGKDIAELFPENREIYTTVHQKARMMGKVTIPLHSQKIRGKETWWEGAVTPVDLESGKGTLISTIDVTDRVEFEKEREQLFAQIDAERIRLRTILDTLPVGIIITDAHGRTLEANAIRDKIWGGSAPAKRANEYARLEGWWADTGIKIDECPLTKAVKHGQTTLGAVIDIVREDGSRGTVLVSAAPIKNNKGKVLGALSVIQDITQQRQLEFDLLEAKSRAELYVDLLTHDVNNFNTAALGYLQLLEEKAKMSEKEERWLEKSIEALDDSSKLIENVRKIQHIEAEDTKRGLIDLDLMLKDVAEEHANPPGKKVKISVVSKGDHFVVGGELLKDVFTNIIGNAIKHSSGSVKIRIEISSLFDKGVQYHRVAVEDSGPGVPDEMKGKIFSRLQRGSTKAEGRGLGLYIVRRLVEDIHGRVWVEDRVPGDHSKGAKFVVLLPGAGGTSSPTREEEV